MRIVAHVSSTKWKCGGVPLVRAGGQWSARCYGDIGGLRTGIAEGVRHVERRVRHDGEPDHARRDLVEGVARREAPVEGRGEGAEEARARAVGWGAAGGVRARGAAGVSAQVRRQRMNPGEMGVRDDARPRRRIAETKGEMKEARRRARACRRDRSF